MAFHVGINYLLLILCLLKNILYPGQKMPHGSSAVHCAVPRYYLRTKKVGIPIVKTTLLAVTILTLTKSYKCPASPRYFRYIGALL